MNLRHLQYFIAVAEELHFGRAAARLHIAQPPLSQMIRRLETELKAVLFRRNRRKVELTAGGSAFLVHARLALAELERGREAASRAERGQVGQLVLGMVPSGDTKLFIEVLRRFGERFPEVRLVLQSLSTTAQVEAIQEGHLDVGFLRMPVRAPRLAIHAISRETLVVALPSSHPLARKKTVTLADLSDEPNIMFPRRLAPDYYDSIVSLFRQSGQRLQIAQEAEHVQMHLSLIAGGFGLSLLPSSMQDFRLRGVAYRPIADAVPVVETAIAYRPDNRSEVLHSLLAVVEETAPQLRSLPAGSPQETVSARKRAKTVTTPPRDGAAKTRPSPRASGRTASPSAPRRRQRP
jgi:DNA-binding transcriptional LysR family regulator